MESPRKKKTMGRQKIEMKRIEKKSSLQVTFTKRRMGLFRKASEMSILCGSEMAILVQSPANKVFAFGNESLLDRLHRQTPGFVSSSSSCESDSTLISSRSKYAEAVKKLDDEKMRCLMESSGSSKMKNGFWWDADIENIELRELEEFVEALEGLRSNVSRGVDKITIDDSSSSSLLALESNTNNNCNHDEEDGAAEFNYTDLLELDYFDNGREHQHCDEMNRVEVDDLINYYLL